MRATRLVSIAVVSVSSLVLMAPAWAEADLSGRWNSDSLRDNGVGYYLVVTPVPTNTSSYVGSLRFRYQDGRQGPRTPVTISTRGTAVTITARRGSFDRSDGILRGVLDPGRDTLTLTNCRARLTLVMAHDLDSDCVFRPAPID